MRKDEAKELYGQARAAWEAEEWEVAAVRYEELLALLPDAPPSAVWWYDAALAYKFVRNWDKAFSLGREAAARAPRGEGDPAFWNLGIAATILREWAVARDAWTGFGVTVPEGDGEIVGRFGMCCVRLGSPGKQEVVWVARLCPTRARVISVPVTSGRRFGEVVLHDGEPKGERVVDGHTYSVFDEILLFEASDLPTHSVTVSTGAASDIDELTAVFERRSYGAEPASSFELICACCSEGSHEQTRSVHAGTQQVSVAAPPDEIPELLDLWATAGPGRSWTDLSLVD
ncbi:tetratricopeptide repeat protein [Streptomyces sp. H39-S7]|uniref:tetratricopeptide repeat protein n=1 Tax=Streptomyces sp. H39-S7 TaxID=3004357 RepID=UPI0022AEDD68|nr:tetratricopeptide repeat protein [Streptomyces sp. H39-S7]MCZ4119141.1 tetratricopeptide repeat protein [Streptomyces sp. H39-S7]